MRDNGGKSSEFARINCTRRQGGTGEGQVSSRADCSGWGWGVIDGNRWLAGGLSRDSCCRLKRYVVSSSSSVPAKPGAARCSTAVKAASTISSTGLVSAAVEDSSKPALLFRRKMNRHGIVLSSRLAFTRMTVCCFTSVSDCARAKKLHRPSKGDRSKNARPLCRFMTTWVPQSSSA